MPTPDSSDEATPPLFVVGVGASAGGLEALQRLFEAIRPTGRLAFVVVQHLSPDFKSLMDELLARHTRLAIRRAETGMRVEADAIYLLPPKKEITISDGCLALRDREPDQGLSLPIDLFFTALAADAGPRAVAVVLSGTGTDGSRGVRSVHEAGGLVLVQSEESAKFDGMPRSAIDTGLADAVLPPEGLAAALVRLAERGATLAVAESESAARDDLDRILELLRHECGVDFSGYKTTTVSRRVERRALLGEAAGVAEYLARLEHDPAELRALYKDLLIGVTRFFRDAEAFERLRRDVFPLLVDRLPPGEELRLWVPACATGEEAYSLGILALEAFRAHGRPPRLKVFATDVHRPSLDVASPGAYPLDAVASMPHELRERYFARVGDHVQVSQDLRAPVVFAHHNVLRDAPFTRVDLVSCRNLLIYFKPGPQRKVLGTFHFALKANGILFLGPSEAPGTLADEFVVVDPRWKIFRKRRDVRLTAPDLSSLPARPESARAGLRASPDDDPRVRTARAALVQRFAPPTLVVDDAFNLLHAFNGAGRYLTQRDGKPSLNVVDLLAGELKFVVGAALKRVAKEREPTSYGAVSVGQGPAAERVTVVVSCAETARGEETLLVSFVREQERAEAPPPSAASVVQADLGELARERIAALELELRQTRENLQATVEEMETGNEELQATNEELIASNEELQSTNEELHSVNEELYTVNAEYQAKIAELTELTADMNHLLEATQVHTLFLDRELRLRRFTPRMGELFNLLPQDVGRSIEGFAHGLDHPALVDDLRAVLASGDVVERDVADRKGHAFLLRVLPYRPGQIVEGVVVTLIDVGALKDALRHLTDSEERYRTLVRASTSVVWSADAEGRFVEPQPEWEAYTGQGFEAQRGEGWLDAVHPEDRDRLRAAWARALAAREICDASGRLWHAPSGEYRWFVLRAAPLASAREVRGWVGTVLDVHDARLADSALHERTAQLRGILDNAPAAIWVKDLTGRYLLASRSFLDLLGRPHEEVVGRSDDELLPPDVAGALRASERAVRENGETVEVEDEVPRGGERRTFLAVKFPLRDGDGRISALAGVATDITERKRAAEESQLAVQRRDHLLAMLSHELRTPLGAILNAAEILARSATSDASRRPLDIVRRQSQHMSRLLDDLLDVARLTRNQLRVDRRPVDLVAVARDAVVAAQPAAEKKGIALRLGGGDEPVTVNGDPVRLQQVVSNLVANAIRYTNPGGDVALSVAAGGGEARVVVRDTGIGMSAEELARAFELFYQAPQSLDRPTGGLGVGLSLAQRLAELHGGSISAASGGRGRGSEFVVRLPLARGAAASPARDGVERRPRRLRVAIVEDNDDIRETMREILELEGHEVLEAATGPDGAALLVAERPHVAFVDVGLPGLDGYAVARRVRDAVGGAVRLVALTGYGRPEDRASAVAAGFDAHAVKPLEADGLLRLLAREPEPAAPPPNGADGPQASA